MTEACDEPRSLLASFADFYSYVLFIIIIIKNL